MLLRSVSYCFSLLSSTGRHDCCSWYSAHISGFFLHHKGFARASFGNIFGNIFLQQGINCRVTKSCSVQDPACSNTSVSMSSHGYLSIHVDITDANKLTVHNYVLTNTEESKLKFHLSSWTIYICNPKEQGWAFFFVCFSKEVGNFFFL